MRFTPKKITLLIAGAVFTAGLAVGFVIPVFAADDYNSSRSNTSISVVNIPIANKHVGDILLRYGAGGAEINEVTDALARGISTADLKAMLVKFGVSDTGIEAVFTKLDELGAGADSPEKEFTTGGAVSAPAAGKTPQPAAVNREVKRMSGKVSAPNTQDDPRRGKGSVNFINKPDRGAFHDTQQEILAEFDRYEEGKSVREKTDKIEKLRANREAFQTEIISVNLTIRENAKALRDNFRENVKTTIGHVDHGKTARIAVAHGKGLRMLNRYRSAMVRFDHILSRLESRIEKMRIEFEAEERAKTGSVNNTFPPRNMAILIEKAKNMSVENEAKMEELKAKYESLLLGENAKGVLAKLTIVPEKGEEARALAAELKTDIENLRAIIIEIYTQGAGYRGGVDFNSSRSNTSI
ncbi:MAG: hypothetical protein HYW89_04465 [Candidatus Sungiibacteriota bacterium]|uniref:Uncharacterized protein n=1 Tax=Candidatus Sungiibacteriota bacterium TaxID=2750080 RepID=A0A7T5RJE5_9BACT|nr:MAG: hypothetical protein HYW89_04465 [Candidatus Sungbacteria bacterium]